MKAIARLPKYLSTAVQTNRRQPVLPRFLTYIVTFTCNAKCIMCDSWKMSGKDDLKLEEIEKIIPQLPKMDAVRLTGGEPFVRKDLLEIAHLVQRHLEPFFLHITTNGFLTSRIVEFCEKRDKTIPLSVLISLDGVADKHNYVRGKETAWETATATLRELAKRKKEFNLSLAVNQTIVDADGVEHYRKLHEFLRPLGVNHNMVMAYDVSATYSLERGKEVAPAEIGQFTTFGDFNQEHLDELFAMVERDLEHLPVADRAAKRYYMRGIKSRLTGQGARPNPKCVALSAHMRLYPNGDVPVCQFNSKTVGNFREKSFEEIWFGEDIAFQRAWVNKCPGCWAECEVLPSAIYTGDLLKETLLPSRG